MVNFINRFASSRRRRASSTEQGRSGDLPGSSFSAGGSSGGSSSESRSPPAPRGPSPPTRSWSQRDSHSQPLPRRSSSRRRGSSTTEAPGPDIFGGGGSSSSSSYPAPPLYTGSDSLYGTPPSPLSLPRHPPMDMVRCPSSPFRPLSYPNPPPLRRRRDAIDLSAQAFDRFDPLFGALRTAAEYRRQSDEDVELPRYRSASAYARDPGGLPPGYYGGRSGSSDVEPPRYTSIGSSEGDDRPPPMQYPCTRRASAYDRSGMGPDSDYEVRKWEGR